MQAKFLRHRVRSLWPQLSNIRHLVGNSLHEDEERGQRHAAAMQLIDDVPTDVSDDDDDMRTPQGTEPRSATSAAGGRKQRTGAIVATRRLRSANKTVRIFLDGWTR